MAQERLADALRACRECFPQPEFEEASLGENGERGYCFKSKSATEALYVTYVPPRQSNPAYRWVCAPVFDLIFSQLEALILERALRLEVVACVRALTEGGNEPTVTPLANNPHGFDIALADRRIHFIHRPHSMPHYAYYEYGCFVNAGSTLEAARSGGVLYPPAAAMEAVDSPAPPPQLNPGGLMDGPPPEDLEDVHDFLFGRSDHAENNGHAPPDVIERKADPPNPGSSTPMRAPPILNEDPSNTTAQSGNVFDDQMLEGIDDQSFGDIDFDDLYEGDAASLPPHPGV